MKRFVDLHHIVPWPKGRTRYWNLITLCPAHHALIHKLGWRVAFEDEQPVWFRPLGRRYEPGPAPPGPPAVPVRYRPMLGKAAGYARLGDLIRLLARRPPELTGRPIPRRHNARRRGPPTMSSV